MTWILLALLAQAKPRVQPPPENLGPIERGTWGTLSYIYPAHLDGKSFMDENAVGGRLDFEDHFGIDIDFAFELDIHYEIGEDTGFMVINFTGVWFSGDGTFGAPTAYGGLIYPAGTSWRSEGHYLWYELGYGYQFRIIGESLMVWGAFTFAGDNWVITQTQSSLPTDQYHYSYTVLAGGRVGAVFRPLPFLAVGVEAGGWLGGLTYKDDERVEYSNSSWSTMVKFWVSVDVSPGISARFGYYLRAADMESDHTHAAPTRAENDDLFIRFGGPIFSIEFHY